MKHLKIIQQELKKALKNDPDYQAGQENAGLKTLAAGIGAMIGFRADQYTNEESAVFSKKLQEYAQEGHLRNAMNDFYENYSATDMKKDIENVVLSFTEDIPAFQTAILIKKLPDLLPAEKVGELAQYIVDNVQVGVDDPAAMAQIEQVKSIGPMLAEQKAAEFYTAVEAMSIPEIAQAVKANALMVSSMIPEQKIEELYEGFKENAYDTVAAVENGEHAKQTEITTQLFSTLAQAFTDYASKDTQTSANAFGSAFKQNMVEIVNKVQAQNSMAKKANNIVTGRKFKL